MSDQPDRGDGESRSLIRESSGLDHRPYETVSEHLALGAEARRIRHRDEVDVDR